jgi:V/A-type H+-transporting ATPase subunit E
MAEINNLDILTDKVYKEGIEKAQQDSKAILAKAEDERAEILQAAHDEAQKTIGEARREAERITRTVKNELQLKGKQLISDLKTEIHQLLSQKILAKSTHSAFVDVDFVKSAILEAIRTWQPNSSLEIVLPREMEVKLEDVFHQSLREYAKNFTITFNDKLTEGFRITERDQGYQIAFSDKEFLALFTPYLEHQTELLLFDGSA